MKNVKIKITLTDDKITFDGENMQELTENDIIDSIKVLVCFAKTMFGWEEGAKEDENA
nr:MAG TPA: hypothetical protein [Bacteriophage sp.]